MHEVQLGGALHGEGHWLLLGADLRHEVWEGKQSLLLDGLRWLLAESLPQSLAESLSLWLSGCR